MACVLEPGDRVTCDAKGHVGAQPVVCVRSKAAPQVTVLAATMNAAAVPMAGTCCTLPALIKGANLLKYVLEKIAPGDDVQLVERCGGAEEQLLCEKTVGGDPPVIGFRISAR